MDKNDWEKHWNTGVPFWQETEVNPYLKKYFPKDAKRVFVPLCGKSLDMLW
jgi:thiopurine S-methyltransferase